MLRRNVFTDFRRPPDDRGVLNELVTLRHFAPRYFSPRFFGLGIPPMPMYQGSGAYSRVAGNVAITPGFPRAQAGDVLLMQTAHMNNSTQAAATYTFPDGWELLYADTTGTTRQWIHRKVADGTETGTVSITNAGGTALGTQQSVIHAFSNANPTAVIGPAVVSGAATAIADAPVTTDAPGRLALQFGALSASETVPGFTGETGGKWAMASQATADTMRLFLLIADMPLAGTIGGGTFTKSGTGRYIIRGFALKR
ncbi:MAG: hypothetical protein IPK79_01260 [Vampirovibrionales bacterium]|nr:hypothetical protein [Vampirovibrionales bacterium]